jgi:hypothetical protein
MDYVNPSLGNGQFCSLVFGSNNATNGAGEVAFFKSASDSSNQLLLGFYGSHPLSIVANGYVGVGTSNPQYTLDVAGAVRMGQFGGTGSVSGGPCVRMSSGFVAATGGSLTFTPIESTQDNAVGVLHVFVKNANISSCELMGQQYYYLKANGIGATLAAIGSGPAVGTTITGATGSGTAGAVTITVGKTDCYIAWMHFYGC